MSRPVLSSLPASPAFTAHADPSVTHSSEHTAAFENAANRPDVSTPNPPTRSGIGG